MATAVLDLAALIEAAAGPPSRRSPRALTRCAATIRRMVAETDAGSGPEAALRAHLHAVADCLDVAADELRATVTAAEPS